MSYAPFAEWTSAIDDQLKAEAKAEADEAAEKLKANHVKPPGADVTEVVSAETDTRSSMEDTRNSAFGEKTRDLQTFAAQRRKIINDSISLVLEAKTVPEMEDILEEQCRCHGRT